MKLLITGATGFAGKHLIRYLSSLSKYEIRVLLRTANDDNLKFLNENKITDIIKGDITNPEACLEAGKEIDVIIHLAAYLSDFDPWKKFESINVNGTGNIVQSAIKNSVKQFIHISTNDVFGFGLKGPITEDTPLNPDNFGYCKSKAIAQKKLIESLKKAEIPFTILYPLWIFGPEDRTFIPGLIEILEDGTGIYIGKSKKFVPLTYVKNLAYYIEKSILNKEVYNNDFFIGLDEKVTWQEFYKFFEDELGFKPKYTTLPRWLALALAWMIELPFYILPIKSRPPITRYVIKNFSNQVWYSPEKVRQFLGPAPYNLEKSAKETFGYFKEKLSEKK